jgi:hypothetical protein
MGSTDLLRVQRSVRWAYELGRLQRAVLGVAPLFVVIAAAASFAHRPASALAFGCAAALAGLVMLWYGRDAQRAVLPGVAAGLVPLVLALCANRMHLCGPDGCTSLCLPACALGGVVAGLTVAGVGNQRRAGVEFWLCASSLALLTGAMGCACIGYSGLIGLGLGFGAGVVPGLLRKGLANK